MSPRPLAALLGNALVVALLGAVYGRDLADWLELRGAEVASATAQPLVGLAVLGLAVAAAGACVLALALAQRRGPGWRPLRLVPLAGLGLLFVDLLVLSSARSPVSAGDRAAAATQLFAEHASALATAQGVAVDAAALQDGIGGLGPAPYLLRGAPVGPWQLELRHGCQGPAGDAGAARPGTFIYCVATGGARAWVTAVGLAGRARAGAAAVVSTEPDDVGLVAFRPRLPDDSEEYEEDAPRPADVSEPPTPDSASDSGR